MTKKHLKSLLFALCCSLYTFVATAAVSLFSEYGQIQNVQNYSTNPFWSPNAPYNQRLPQPVYVQGADLNADDCINVVQSLVSVQCMARDNCKNTELSDVRPAIMVQLSNLPGHNYVSACSGYIDNIFESYVRQYSNTLPNRPTAFPDATVPNPDLDDDDGMIKFENPYKRQPAKWKQEENERARELQGLQRQNGVGNEHITKTDFPATYADLSFSARMANDAAGLEPFKDMKAYKTLDVKGEAEWCNDGHMDSSECAAYKARIESVAQQQNDQNNGNNSNSNNGNNNNDENDNNGNNDENDNNGNNGGNNNGGNNGGNGGGKNNGGKNNTTDSDKLAARIHKRASTSNRTGKTGNSGRGCFAICGKNPLDDDLNEKVFKSFKDGAKYCADKNQDGLLVKSVSGGNPLLMTKDEYNKIKTKIQNEVADKGSCDGHGRDYIMEIGHMYSGKFSADYETIKLDD